MSQVKNQHYVPQFLLKRFSLDGKSIFVFDKGVKKSFRRAIADVASKKWFYELPAGAVRDTQAVEKALSGLEGLYAVAISELLDEVEQSGRLTPGPSERNQVIAHCILIQACRTQEFRASQNDAYRLLTEQILEMHAHRGLAPYDPPVMTPFDHAQFMFDGPFVDRVFPILLNHIWLIGENQTSQPLHISDAPVALRANLEDSMGGGRGFTSPGIEIHFPLSSRYILILLERSCFEQGLNAMGIEDGDVLKLTPEEVKFYNGRQVHASYRQIYCQDDQFELVFEMIGKWPELGEPDRPRFEIKGSKET